MENVKITELQVQNLKKVKAVEFSPNEKGLTVIGGNNGQGKTSILDAIAWGLGGEKFKPTKPVKEGSDEKPYISIKLSNGLIVERKGVNSSLKVTDPTGTKSGQQLLNEFISSFALDLPKFMNASTKEKGEILLKLIGVGDELNRLDNEVKSKFEKRTAIGQIAAQKQKAADDMVFFPGLPPEPKSSLDLIKKMQGILLKNAENEKIRGHVTECEEDRDRLLQKEKNVENMIDNIIDKIAELKRQQDDLEKQKNEIAKGITNAVENVRVAKETAENLQDESTKAIEEAIENIDSENEKIRNNTAREAKQAEAETYRQKYDELSGEISEARNKRQELLKSADLPLPGLNVVNGELQYNGIPWDGISSSQQLIIATSIVGKLNPKCGFVLMDKLEQMDINTLSEFGEWLKSVGLQVIATRVSTGDECSIIIEDGEIKNNYEGIEKTIPYGKDGF